MIIGMGGYPLSLAMSDFNMNSTPEIVVTNWEVEGMRVIHNFLPVNDNTIQGDFNNDGMINIQDLIILVNMILANEYSTIADLNEDGVVNILDIIIYVNIILSNKQGGFSIRCLGD